MGAWPPRAAFDEEERSTVKIGVYGVCTDQTLRPDEVARLVEDAGFDSLVFGEHSHIPVSRESPYPGGELPEDYKRTYDLFINLTAAALATSTLRVSSGIMQLAQRDPITTAKEAASLDVLSGGRVELIVGHGWNIEEMRNHGVDPDTRYDLVRERMLAMKAIWRDDVASFSGRHVSFDGMWSWPKPVQPGGVPLYYGGNSPGSEERALEYGDGWAPIALPDIPDRVKAFTAENPGVPVVATGVASDPAAIEEYAEAGAHSAILGLGAVRSEDEAKGKLEELRRCVETAVSAG
jgi:probable F420-dependent oxidoreductase